MRIAGVATALPSRKVDNSDVLELVREHSAAGFQGDLGAALRQVEFWLAYSGSRSRRWTAAGERPIELLAEAADSALRSAELRRDQIDVLVYTGVCRGFLEPGSAHHAAAAIGLPRAQCFDVLEACMSWTRATQLVQALFTTGACRTAMIVNAEFNAREGGPVNPGAFALPHTDALTWTFPALTIGEAATATVLTADDGEPWRFAFRSRPDLAELCNIPLPWYADLCLPSDRVAPNGPLRFASYGFEMHEHARAETLRVLEQLGPPADPAALFTHTSSSRWWGDLADEVGLGEQLRGVFGETGNVVSASIPAALSSTLDQGRLARGDRAVGWVGSAGMSFCAFTFTY
jgi:acyl-CoA:acyl-CoA alkyltransferase